MTEHIFGLKVGDELSFKGPNLKFPYKANEFEVRYPLSSTTSPTGPSLSPSPPPASTATTS